MSGEVPILLIGTKVGDLLCVLRGQSEVADEQITCYLAGKNGQRKEHR